MAGIILTILKIIGIILLVVVGIVLALAGTILFWPIRYRVSAYKEQEEVKATVDITWVFRLLRCRAVYETGKDFFYYVKIAFFQILPEKEKKIEEGKQRQRDTEKAEQVKSKETEPEEGKQGQRDTEKAEQVKSEETEPEEGKQEQRDTKKAEQKEAEKSQKQTEEAAEKKPSKTSKENQKAKENLQEEVKKSRKSVFERIEEKIQQIKFTFQKFCDKVKEVFGKLENLKAFLTSEEMKEILKFLNEQRKYVFRRFKPDKFQVDTRFGTEDPALTGQILAAYSVAYPLLPGNWNVVADFEETCLDCNVYLKGRIQLYVLLVVGLRCYKNKTIGKFINIGK